ncbi:M16 family metallopeptidase [Methylomarinum vadi]|uniref:M16 family metallopeptidase n=1 Tax=Methylomarinum vadi TaxID=438855 RepID=UPI0004DF6221|nr:pitrilysin family protein [Methylomarinum vadi]
MRINWLAIVLVVFSHSSWSAANIEHWQTPRGSRVYYVHTEGLPLADIRVTFDAGSARDGYQYGLASITSAMLDTGAGEWNADQIAERFESVGAQFGTGASIDMAWLSLRTLTDKPLFDKAVATLRTILADPSFDEADFQRKKNRTLAALKHREESPGAVAEIAFYKALYQDHPYGHPSEGMVETVAGFTVDDLRQFFRRYYVAANAMVVIVGDLERAQAERLAESLLSGLADGEKPEPIPEITMPSKGHTRHIRFPSTQTHVLSGLPGSYRKDPDYFTLYVGNHILGGSGLVSKLFEEVREKRGLAYSAYSYFSPLYRPGPFTMGLQTRNDQTGKALKIMKRTLTDFIENGPSEKELEAAKKNITGGFVLRFDTNRKLTEYVNMIGFYRLPLDYLETFPNKVQAVTAAQIKDAFQRRVNPKLLQTITVGGK